MKECGPLDQYKFRVVHKRTGVGTTYPNSTPPWKAWGRLVLVQVCRPMSTPGPGDCQALRGPPPGQPALPGPPTPLPCWGAARTGPQPHQPPHHVGFMLPPRFPSSFLRAAPVEGKEGHKGRGRSLCPLGTALPQHRAAQPGEPRPGRAVPEAGPAGESVRISPGDGTGLPPAPPQGAAHGPLYSWPIPVLAAPSPRLLTGPCLCTPSPFTGPHPSLPFTAPRSAQPLTLGSLRPPRLTGPALPARPGHRNAEPQRHRSPPLESTTRWRRLSGRSPALAVIATAPSKARPAALRANPHPSPAPRGTLWTLIGQTRCRSNAEPNRPVPSVDGSAR